MLTVGSLFAGIGGFCSAFIEEDFKVLWANEVDANAALTYKHNYEKVKSKLYTPVLYYSFFNKCKTYNFSKKYAHFYDDHWGEQYVGKVKI